MRRTPVDLEVLSQEDAHVLELILHEHHCTRTRNQLPSVWSMDYSYSYLYCCIVRLVQYERPVVSSTKALSNANSCA